MVAPNGNTTQKAAVAPPRPSRMGLQSIVAGKIRKPLRIVLHGPDGVGKTTLGAAAESAIILPTEDGANQIDVPKFPIAESVDEMREAIRTLLTEKHDYKALTVDSLDWAEALVFKHVADQAKVATIEDVGGGFGKGYQAAVDTWRLIIGDLERLQRERGMHVILIAHSTLKTFKNPEGPDYERYIIKMNEKSAALWREWCDGVYFCNFEVVAKEDKRKRVRGISTGARYLYTQKTGAYDAKDRYGLPERLPLSWEDLRQAYEAGQPADPTALIAEIKRKAAELGGEIEAWTLGMLADKAVATNASKLSTINTRLNAKLGELQEQAAEQKPSDPQNAA